MFEIQFYINQSETIKMDKDLYPMDLIRGDLKENCSLINPTIIVALPANYLSRYNYAYIDEFNRYYYINDMVSISNSLVEISMHVDVLMSFRAEIRKNYGIAKRQENDWNLYLNDGSFKTYQYKTVGTYKFSHGFPSDNDLVLAVAGRSNIT